MCGVNLSNDARFLFSAGNTQMELFRIQHWGWLVPAMSVSIVHILLRIRRPTTKASSLRLNSLFLAGGWQSMLSFRDGS